MSINTGKQLHIGNLPWSVSSQDLRDLFREAGTVTHAEVAQSPAGRSRGYGTVIFSTLDEAENAIETLNGYEWNGRSIEVREDRGPTPRAGGGGGATAGAGAGGAAEGFGRPPIAIGDAPVFNDNGTEGEPVVINVRALYVGNIPYSVAWQDVKDLFRQAGAVYRAEVPQDAQGRSKGYSTLLMGSLDEARKAVAMFNGYEWNGRRLDVREDRSYTGEGGAVPGSGTSTPARTVIPRGNNNQNGFQNGFAAGGAAGGSSVAGRQLFVGNLPFTVQWQELKDLFREVGGVLRADVAVDASGRSRGYGQVLMATVEEAQAAIEQLKGREVGGRAIEVREDKFAASGSHQPRHEQQQAEGAGAGGFTAGGGRNGGGFASAGAAAPGTQVFVGNLPFSSRWQDLKDIFRAVGLNPIHADVMVDGASGRSKGFGIVRFQTTDEAQRAVDEVNGTELQGRNVNVRLDKYAA
ncbi:hypothetical protein HDU86_006676 [Geranomyces michiganensis]|nr:hypothetical protein HDU86_006676 [Geranomyces michiganensis]